MYCASLVSAACLADSSDLFRQANEAYQNQQLESAISLYSQAIDQDPSLTSAYVKRGHVYSAMGNQKQAINDYTEAIKNVPDDYYLYSLRAEANLKNGDCGPAKADYTQAIVLNDQHLTSFNNLAWIYAACHDPQFQNGSLATNFAKRALALSPDNPFVRGTAAAAFARAGDFEQAIEHQTIAIDLLKQRGVIDVSDQTARLELYKSNNAFTASK